jgi:hypothetical protein
MNKETNSYITIQPSSHYHDAAWNANLCKSQQYLVIDFFSWVKWYNEARFQRRPLVPTPVFCGDTYDAALKVCKELNESLTKESQNV